MSDCISRQQAIDALDTAIEHYDGIAEECRKKADIERNDYMDMRDDAYEARQLAQWLNELKYLREKIEQLTIQPEERTVKRMETHGVCLDAISRQAAIDALKQPVATDTNVGDTISRKPAIDALDKQIKQCCKALGSLSLSDIDKHAVEVEMASLSAYREILENLPTVQPEPTDEQVLDYCKKRCLYIVTADVFQSTHLTHKVSFGDKDHVWIDGKQYISLRRFQEAVKEAQPEEGYWIEGGIYRDVIECYCSKCGQLMTTAATVRMDYCPRCGRHMKKGESNG